MTYAHTYYSGSMFNMKTFFIFKVILYEALKTHDKLILWTTNSYNSGFDNEIPDIKFELTALYHKYYDRLEFSHVYYEFKYAKYYIDEKYGSDWYDFNEYYARYLNFPDICYKDFNKDINTKLGLSFTYLIYNNTNKHTDCNIIDYSRIFDNTKSLLYFDVKEHLYDNCKYNEHHVVTSYHYDTIMPALAEKLNIPYNKEDFIEHIIPYNNYECNIMQYKDDSMMFTLERPNCMLQPVIFGSHKILTPLGNKYYSNISPYHQIYAAAHDLSIITNHTINSERVLVVSADSHFIPLAPIIACYFNKVIIYDVRFGKTYYKYMDNINITDYLVQVSDSYGGIKHDIPHFITQLFI